MTCNLYKDHLCQKLTVTLLQAHEVHSIFMWLICALLLNVGFHVNFSIYIEYILGLDYKIPVVFRETILTTNFILDLC